MFVQRTNQLVKDVLFQLKGLVPKGEPVEFHICYGYEPSEPTVHFTALQCFDEEDQRSPQTEPEKR